MSLMYWKRKVQTKMRCNPTAILILVAMSTASVALSQAGSTHVAPHDGASAPATSLSANSPYLPSRTFETASVRENKNIDMSAGFTMSGHFVENTATYRAINWTIDSLISFAYGTDQYRIVGTPKWQWPTMFTIEAKGGREADTKMATLTGPQQQAEVQHMLQGLLADRFKLKVHWETKEGDVYNLVVAKGGPKLGKDASMTLTASESSTNQKCDMRGCEFIVHGMSMKELANTLAAQFGRPVIDKTGLTGRYDFVFKYKSRWEMDRAADDEDQTPPLDRALQEKLGLKVEGAKGPVKVLVVDHVEKPSAN